MSEAQIENFLNESYKHGFVTDIDTDSVAPGLSEEVIRIISAKKNEPEFMLQWRLRAYRHWLTMTSPEWGHLRIEPIDYQAISYYAAPKVKKQPQNLSEVDPKLLETYNRNYNLMMSAA